MPSKPSHEQRFINTVATLEFDSRDVGNVMERLEAWLAGLIGDLDASRLSVKGLSPESSLATQAEAINTGLQAHQRNWACQWASLRPAQELADAFEDKVILLVFGKFNAGKSAFCNFIAERFVSAGRTARYFRVDAGCFLEMPEGFKEGATETTSQLQGVILGDRLVLLDTPGLHSVTAENADLTRRFTDSADGVLWLTSSASPGQVQELEELARELGRNKPLQPVVTRSDVIEEDEVDGEIKKFLLNKSADTRALQETDVRARALDKLIAMGVDPDLLKPPVSISTYVARHQGQTEQAMIETGFERLYQALLEIIGPALRYKQRQPAQMLFHHFEETVLHSLQEDTLSRLDALDESLQREEAQLLQKKETIIKTVWRKVMATAPQLLDRHAAERDTKAVCSDISRSLIEACQQQLDEELADYVLTTDLAGLQVTLDAAFTYEPIVIDNADPQEDAAIMAAAGEVVGISHEALYEAQEIAVRDCLEHSLETVVSQCTAVLDQLTCQARRLRNVLELYLRTLRELSLECQR